jgi:hypothetical protein
MGSWPALDIKPPESPLQQYGQAQQIVGQQQETQMRQLQIQEQTRLLKDQDATTRAMSGLQTDPSGKINYDTLPDLIRQNGGSANAVMKATANVFDMKAKASQIAKDDAATNLSNAETTIKQHDEYRGRILNITDGITDPAQKQAAWDAEITKEEQARSVPPGTVSHTYPGDDKARAIANSFALGSQLVKESQEKQKMAIDAWKPAGGELQNVLTGEKTGGISDVKPLNLGLQSRWNVLHPGDTLPDFFTLKQNASPADFERIDKIMQQEENAKGAVAQQGVANAIRQQSYDFMVDKQGLKPVVGTDPKTGQVVAVPYSQAAQMGIKDAAEMPATEYSKTLSGRQWLKLALTQAPKGAPASDMGISQLLDKMDKAGTLGPLAGRWNDFMTGTWGSGNPDYAALRTKLDLSNTLLGSVHTGRLGPYLLENLAGLAQAKKMDGPTLKSAFNTEISYVKDRALDPTPPNYNATAPGKTAAPASTSATSSTTGAATLPKGNGKAIDKATAQQFYQAAGNDPDKARQLAIQNGWQVPKAQ